MFAVLMAVLFISFIAMTKPELLERVAYSAGVISVDHAT
jgi:hypothetical protein